MSLSLHLMSIHFHPFLRFYLLIPTVPKLLSLHFVLIFSALDRCLGLRQTDTCRIAYFDALLFSRKPVYCHTVYLLDWANKMTFSIERFQTAPTSINQLRFHWNISGKGQTRAGPTRRQTLAKCHDLGENGENGSFTPAHLTLVALDHAAFHSTRYRYMRRVPVSSSPTPPKMKMFNVFRMSSSISVCVAFMPEHTKSCLF